ncbi:MAG: hypothetical protein AAF797_17570 [Planctomycetota bacterium]
MADRNYSDNPQPRTMGQQAVASEALDRLDRIEDLEREQAVKLASIESFIRAKLDGQDSTNAEVREAITKLTEHAAVFGRELQRVEALVPNDHIPAAELRMEMDAHAARIDALEERGDQIVAQLLRIDKKLAWFGGGIVVLGALFELLPRWWPLLSGGAG